MGNCHVTTALGFTGKLNVILREFIRDSELALIVERSQNFAISQVILLVGPKNRVWVKLVKISKFFFRLRLMTPAFFFILLFKRSQ